MTRQEHMTIARVIRKLPCDQLVVAERFAAMLAEQDPRFDRNRFLAAAVWGIERRADGADCRIRARQAPPTRLRAEAGIGSAL